MAHVKRICRIVKQYKNEYKPVGAGFLCAKGVPTDEVIQRLCVDKKIGDVEKARVELAVCVSENFLKYPLPACGNNCIDLDAKGDELVSEGWNGLLSSIDYLYSKHDWLSTALITILCGIIVLYVGATLFPNQLIAVIVAIGH